MAFKVQSGNEQGGQWSFNQLLPRFVAIVIGTLFLVAGLSRLRQPSLQGGEINFGHEKVIVLKNDKGTEAHILTLGAVVQTLKTANREGAIEDVILGFDDLEPYKDGTSPYFGAVVGRVANRIANASFELDGKTYKLSANDPPNSLHGGVMGFSRKSWDIHRSEVTDEGFQSVKLGLTSPSGEEGFPGKVTAAVTYTLTDESALVIHFEAHSDAATPMNLAQHAYFNLDGVFAPQSILEHTIEINSSYVTPVDDTRIPTGEFLPVDGTSFNFGEPQKIGRGIFDVPGPKPGGYDVNYVLWGRDESAVMEHTKECKAFTMPSRAAKVYSQKSGRILEIYTNSPGLQFYSGNMLDGSVVGKGGVAYEQYGGFALETQMFPNFINQPRFPQCTLRPGQRYETTAVWKFSAE